MKPKHYIITIVIALICFASGFWISERFHVNRRLHNMNLRSAANLSFNIATLKTLHDNNIEQAKNLLEQQVDGNLLELSILADQEDPIPDIFTNILTKTKSYRDKYPRKQNYKEIQEGIEKAFNIVEK
jgi:hypothetical protein